MTLAQFMLPGEAVLYESPREVYYRRRPHALVITGGRLLLHASGGVFASGEHVVAEPLSGVRHLEYSEGGLLSARGRLDIHFGDGGTLSITGEPDAIKEVWRALQMHPAEAAPAPVDDEVTLVAPAEPLFDDLPHPPARVELLPVATPRRAAPTRRAKGALLFGALCLVALVAAAALFLLRGRPTEPAAQPRDAPVASPSVTPTPVPTPAPVRVMDETFTLDEGSHRAVKFSIPEQTPGARLSGGFRVTDDGYVDFYVMGEDQYGRFAAGAAPEVTSPVFRREQWNAKVGERLPGGSYYIVFDNPDYGTQDVAAEFFVIFD